MHARRLVRGLKIWTAFAVLAVSGQASAAVCASSVIMTGLKNPRELKFAADGSLYVCLVGPDGLLLEIVACRVGAAGRFTHPHDRFVPIELLGLRQLLPSSVVDSCIVDAGNDASGEIAGGHGYPIGTETYFSFVPGSSDQTF